MLDSHKKSALEKKVYEIAYAVFRVSTNMTERGVAEKLKQEALQILGSVVAGTYADSQKPLEVLDYFVKFAMDLNLIGFANGDVLAKEIRSAQVMVAECIGIEVESVDISPFFSEPVADASENVSSRDFFSQEKIAVSRAEEYGHEHASRTDAVQVFDGEGKSSEGSGSVSGFLKSGMRQIAILDKIRQSGNCRLRDIQEVLPDTSERTIRYDLETLIERKQIERTGNGGPSVSYRMRQ